MAHVMEGGSSFHDTMITGSKNSASIQYPVNAVPRHPSHQQITDFLRERDYEISSIRTACQDCSVDQIAEALIESVDRQTNLLIGNDDDGWVENNITTLRENGGETILLSRDELVGITRLTATRG